MAKEPALKEWTKAEIDALSADDLQPRNGLRIMTEAEVMEMCADPKDTQKMCGELEIETLRRHRKIRRRGRARPGKGQMNLNFKQRDDR